MNLIVGIILLVGCVQSTQIQCHLNTTRPSPNNIAVSQRGILTRTIYGFSLVVDVEDKLTSTTILQMGYNEPQNLRTYARFVKEGDNVLVVGAHVGLQSVLLGRIIGSKGLLFAVEPYSISYRLLEQNIFLNNLQGYTSLYRLAVSNRRESGELLVNLEDTGASKVQERGRTISVPHLSTKHQVNITKVDYIIPQEVNLNFVLLDGQRLELQILEGMKEVIDRSKDLIMFIKWPGFSLNLNQKIFINRARTLLQNLSEKGFKFYRLERQSYWIPSSGCKPENFIELDICQIIKFTTIQKVIIDLVAIRGKVDPNMIF